MPKSWRGFYAAAGLLFVSGEMSRNGRDREYAPVVDALAPVLYNLPPRIIAIDGRPGCGKTTLGRFLAWWLNVSLIETDLFLFEGEGRYRYREEEIGRIIDFRIRAERSVIVEGVTVLRRFAATNRDADFLVYVENASSPRLRPEYEVQFKEYETEFKPRPRADFTLALDH
ncbi:hypothetical protein [Bradyrhizobium uaiense]|uniref:AAA family ATPase n=1 Tax=Bradyrhizobium uaiense TaxID=2594946 RepID=A0A6P1BG42_9BRAD|nr:hypothetical protein [Bradyrhizobium uaiense]NEU97506.1 hypothetical protein [Bradyrhizobium uaiense]